MSDMYFVWVPEHPRLPAYRAKEPRQSGKIGQITELLTSDIHEALQFGTRMECERWIAENPHPLFVAREHGIAA